jgi:hypothetical protein
MAGNLRALIDKLNPTTRAALEAAAGLCLSRTHYDIEPEHYLLKLLDETTADVQVICRRFSVDRSRLAAELTRTLDKLKSGNSRNPALSPYVLLLLREAWCVASLDFNAIQIRGAFILLALLNGISNFEMPAELRKIDAAELAGKFSEILTDSGEKTVTAPQLTAEPPTRTGPARVFISYRHGDGDDCAERLYDRLLATVPGIEVFRDVDTLKLGDDFAKSIEANIQSCDVLIAVIGKQWSNVTQSDGHPRLESERDYVRMEIAAALRAEKRVIPLLVNHATMPGQAELPSDIAAFAARHGLNVGTETFRYDTEELVKELTRLANTIRT